MSEPDEIFLTEVDYEDPEFPLVWASISPHSGGSRYVRAALLADPNAVYLNMLRGTIAKPSLAQIAHIYGDECTAAVAERDRMQTLIEDCLIYLKDGETPRQRMDRDHADVLSLMEMLAKDRKERDAARAERDRLIYVLGGVRRAIQTGRNEPLQIWSEQIDIAFAAIGAKP